VLLSDAASLATKLETKMSEIESWLDDIDAEDSRVSINDDVYNDPEKLRLDRQSLTVSTVDLCATAAANVSLSIVSNRVKVKVGFLVRNLVVSVLLCHSS